MQQKNQNFPMTLYVKAMYEDNGPINSEQSILYNRPVSCLKISIRFSSIASSSDGGILFGEYVKNHRSHP